MEVGWPFRGAEAIKAGALSARELRRFYRAVYPGVYVPRGVEPSPAELARAAWLWSRGSGVVAGLSAAAIHGSKWIDSGLPAELVCSNRRAPELLRVHTDILNPDEITRIGGVAVTTAARTIFDMGRRLPVTEAVKRIDALMNATKVGLGEVHSVADRHPGVRGMSALRTTLELVDGGAESPYESLTRLMLIRAGLPRPQTQIRVVDQSGHFVAYLDMGWRDRRVAVEFDGAQHWTDARQRRRDIERSVDLDALGWIVIRVSSDMLRTPGTVVERVRVALARR